MKKTTSLNNALPVFLFIFMMLITASLSAQVGIGTVTPDASSVLDVTSTTQGVLTPRMTTTQKNAITSPANGLMVFDTTLKGFYFYDTTTSLWLPMNNVAASSDRLNFKRIKSTDVLATVLASEKAAGGGTKYVLNTNTLYEINGTISVDLPIDLNNAYITGLDTNEDKLVKATGNLFDGSKGGSIRNLVLQATLGNVFNLTASAAESFIFRDSIVVSSANVGTISGFGLVFCSIVQYVGNSNGVIYNNITKLLLSNIGWFGNNSGTFEKLTGTFGLVQKQSGFTEVTGTSIGLDVSSNPIITGDAVLREVVFTGTLGTGQYVNRYTSGSYTNFNFNNKWTVNCPGIPREDDSAAVGDANSDFGVGSGSLTTLSGTPTKLNAGTTTSTNLFRFSTGSTDNRLQYLGNKKRFFKVSGASSFQSNGTSSNNTIFIFYIAKNGTVINQSKIYVLSNSSNDVLAVPFQTIVELSPNDYVEVYAQRFVSGAYGSGNVLSVSMNLIVN